MATFNKFNSFVEAIGQKKHNLNADILKLMFTNTLPGPTNAVKVDIIELAAGNGYVAGGPSTAPNSYVQTTGIAKLLCTDVTVTAVGGSVGPFRYAVLYNSTALNGELIGWWDYGSSQTLAIGESMTSDFDGVAGVLTNT